MQENFVIPPFRRRERIGKQQRKARKETISDNRVIYRSMRARNHSRACTDVACVHASERTNESERGGGKSARSMINAPDTHHAVRARDTSRRASLKTEPPQCAASRNHYAKMQSPDNRSRAAPSRGLISPICTAVGETETKWE